VLVLFLHPKLYRALRSGRVLLKQNVWGKGAGRVLGGTGPQGPCCYRRDRRGEFLPAFSGASMVKDNLNPPTGSLDTSSLKL